MFAYHVFAKILIQIMELSTEELLKKYSKNISHPQEVRRICMMLFEEASRKVFEMSQVEKKYLESAALLHDIGYYKEAKGHNKHSMKMIIKEGLSGFSEQETKIIACIARYHRGSLPDKEEHDVYNTLEKHERKIVKRLGGILKLADGLDKAHKSIIEKIKLDYDYKNSIVKVFLVTNGELLDISAAIRKRDLFEVGFKCQSVLLLGNNNII